MDTNPKPTSNRNLMIGVAVALVLCCCGAVTAVGGYYAYQAYVQAQEAVEAFQDFEIPTSIPSDPNDPNSPSIPIPGFDISGEVPQGGLSDDSTRYTAWLSLQVVGAIAGCETPTAKGTTIIVLQQPDSNGEWVEEWNVDCGDGSFQPFKVTFTPENGVVNVNVELP